MPEHDATWVAKHLGRATGALFTDDELELLSAVVSPVTLPDGKVLFDRGKNPGGVWIIQTGWIELLVGAGRSDGIIALLGPRQCAGDVPLLLGTPAPYRARTAGETTCLFTSAEQFERLLADNGKIALRWATKVGGLVAHMQGRVFEMLGKSLRQQVARSLLNEGEDGSFPFSQETCAAMLGVARTAVNQVLKELEREGVVSLHYRHVDIADERALFEIAGDPRSSSS